jgi:hypothetical protein
VHSLLQTGGKGNDSFPAPFHLDCGVDGPEMADESVNPILSSLNSPEKRHPESRSLIV